MLQCKKRLSVLFAVCAPIATGVAAFGQTTTYTAAAGDHAWGTPGNWNHGLPAPAGTAIFNNSATGNLSLGGVTRSVDTLEFDNNIGLSGNPNYTLTTGTLSLNHLVVTGSVVPGNRITANVSAAGSTLSADLQTNATTFIDGALSAPTLNITNSFPGLNQGTLQLSNPANQLANISVGGSSALVATTAGALGSANINVDTNGMLSVFTNTAIANYANNIHASLGSSISSTITPGALAPANSQFGALSLDNDSDISLFALGASLSFSSTTLNGDSIFNVLASTGNVVDLGAVHQSIAGSALTNNGSGITRISGASDYTGGTTTNIGFIDATADGALGHGAVQINANGAIRLAHQSAANFNATNIAAYGAIGGDLSNAHYSGPSRNVTAAPGTIFFSMTPGTSPVRGVDVSTPAYLNGITDNAQTIQVGDSPTSIYYGVAFGLYSPAGTYAGAISEISPGQGISVYTTTTLVQYIGGATLNSISGPAGAGGVNFFGPGEVRLVAPILGTASVYNVTGAPDFVSDNNRLMSLFGVNTLTNGRTINISNGRLRTGDGRSLATGSTVNVLDTGTLELNDYAVAGINPSPAHGTINVSAGGAVYIASSTANPAGGATFNWSPGSLLILGAPTNTGSPTWISPNSDVIVESNGAFTGSGIVLGNGRRLTAQDTDIALFGGTGISAAPGATHVLITASTDHTLEVDDDVNLTGVDLQIGDTNPFHGVRNSTARATLAQDGTVLLTGAATARNLTIAAGGLTIDGTLTAAATINNAAFTIDGSASIATLTGTGTTSVTTGATLTGNSIRQAALHLDAGAQATILPSGHTPGVGSPTINVVNDLQLDPAAQLDISDGDLIVNYTGASPLGSIAAALKTGYNAGHWTGNGIASSAASSDASGRTALGYIDNADFAYTTFNGEPVDANSILVKYTYYGDNTLDGKVDLGNDFNLFLEGFLAPGGSLGSASWTFGDYNYDGVVTTADFQLFINGYAAQGGSLGTLDQFVTTTSLLSISQRAAFLAVVPEPSSAIIITASVFATLRRRQKRG